ncbi:LacI family transcriptional regulator, partial [Lacticaseibacillus rhamnosus]
MEDASSRRVTQKDIADRTGHSLKTVNLALNNSPRVGPAAKKAIEDVAADPGYVFHRERAGRLGLVAGAINHPYYSDVIDAIVQAASLEAGYGVDIRITRGFIGAEVQATREFQRKSETCRSLTSMSSSFMRFSSHSRCRCSASARGRSSASTSPTSRHPPWSSPCKRAPRTPPVSDMWSRQSCPMRSRICWSFSKFISSRGSSSGALFSSPLVALFSRLTSSIGISSSMGFAWSSSWIVARRS